MRSRNEVMTPEVTGMAHDNPKDTSRIFELEQRCAALEEQADLDTIRMGRLAESNQKLKDLNREMFVSRCQAHMSAEAEATRPTGWDACAPSWTSCGSTTRPKRRWTARRPTQS